MAAYFSDSQKGLDETAYKRLRSLIDDARDLAADQEEASS